jgi:glycosyltransferase involved in cell wall biosynthesis
MTNPKITVIIPTRERCGVLESSLRTVTMQDYDNLEIIVSDNFSQDDTCATVLRAHDSRIRYLNTGKRLNMSHNWEFALSHVDDGWVTFMGDDDGLMPRSMQTVADTIRTTQAKVIRSNFCVYDWPGVLGRERGQLVVPLASGVETRKSSHWLADALHGRVRYSQLPMIYNGGFIHISVMKQIKERLGSFFLSANPDIYTAIAIARITDDYLYIREPLVISGTSKHSNGYSAFSTSKDRSHQPYKQFLDEGNIPFHRELPATARGEFPLSLQACVYEAYLQSQALGSPVDGVNHAQQLAVILATSGKHRASIEAWGRNFSEMHRLAYADIRRIAASKRIYLQSRTMIGKLRRSLNSVITEKLPIRNVYDASVAAAVIRLSPRRRNSLLLLASQLVKSFKR